MKKYVSFIFIIVILTLVSTAAMASESYWALKIRAGWSDGALGNDTVYLGAAPSGTAQPHAVLMSTVASMASTNNSNTEYYSTHLLDSGALGPYQFTLTLAVGTDFSDHVGDPHQGMVWISAWTPEKYMGTTGRALPIPYLVKVGSAAGRSDYAAWTYLSLYVGTTEPVTAAPGPVGFWFDYAAHNASFADSTDKLYVTVNGYGATPEPASLLGLAGGLLGLAGFALRKRKA